MKNDRSWTILKLEGPTWLLIGMAIVSVTSVIILTFILSGQG